MIDLLTGTLTFLQVRRCGQESAGGSWQKLGLDWPPAVRFYERFLKKAPKQSRSRTLVESVLSAATELVGRSADEDEVTIQAVAERAGVGVGSLYDYFSDRGSVFTSLAAKLSEDNLRRFEAELEPCRDKPLDVAVRRIVDLLFDTYLVDVRIPRVVSILRVPRAPWCASPRAPTSCRSSPTTTRSSGGRSRSS